MFKVFFPTGVVKDIYQKEIIEVMLLGREGPMDIEVLPGFLS